MSPNDTLQVVSVLLVLFFLSPVLGEWIAKVLEAEKNVLGFMRPLEVGIYRAIGVRENEQMNWKPYLKSVIAFSVVGFVVLFLLQILQGRLPLNPQNLSGLSWHLAFNTAASFVSNTNWQSYGGESTMSYFVQMMGLAVQNFVSAGTGIAVLVALARGLWNRESEDLGTFWVDLTRTTLYVLLPLSFIFALVLVGQGVVQNFLPYVTASTLDGGTHTLPMGPAASQIAIKQLGTNGCVVCESCIHEPEAFFWT